MKLSKGLFLAFAGLGLFACSNEDVTENNQFPEGLGAVRVKLVNPALSRAIESPTGGITGSTTIPIEGEITVSLYESTNLTNAAQTIIIDAEDITATTDLTFWNVTSPGKITVSINGGQDSYSAVSITNVQQLPAKIPAYGETTQFTKTSDTDSPTIANDNDSDTGNKTEQGAQEGDQNKTYQLYSASVTMAIPVARLEVSGITHVDDEGSACAYNKLTIAGAYMDNLYTQGGSYSEDDKAYGDGATLQNYCWLENQTPSLGTGSTAVLKDEIPGNAEARNFLTGTWPSDGKAFAYNFYAGDTNPVFKIYFDESESSSSTNPLPAPRFAMVTEYTMNGGPVTFENGKIYRITGAELTDSNIIGDEGGNTLYGVTVTVTEATWSLVDITATWK